MDLRRKVLLLTLKFKGFRRHYIRGKTEGRRRKTEGGRRKAEGGKQKAESRRYRCPLRSAFCLVPSARCPLPLALGWSTQRSQKTKVRNDTVAHRFMVAILHPKFFARLFDNF